MQIFPSKVSALSDKDAALPDFRFPEAEDAGFGALLSSFIEDGRFDYTGRPSGFAACEKLSGTLGNDRADLFKNALLKRNIPEENILRLEERIMSGAPITIGSAFSALVQKGRVSESLGDEERDAFKMLLGKLGLSKDDLDSMVELSDDGKGSAMIKRLQQAMGELEGSLDVTLKEFKALIKGLDLDEKTQSKLLGMFGEAEEQSVSASDLEALLNEAGKELARRDLRDVVTMANMRPAMIEALEAAKIQKQSAPVEDTRGSRRSEQLESIMHDTVLKKTGADRIKQDFANPDESGHEQPGDERGRERHMENGSPFRQARAAESETPGQSKRSGAGKTESAAERLFQRLDLTGMPAQTQATPAQARNLDSLARNHSREIFSQVESGILHGTQNGAQRISLQIAPEELGKLTIVLSMHQGELKATITAENHESAAVLGEQIAELKASLEAEGIKVKELDVQTQMQDNRFGEQWRDQQNHNALQDAQERDRMLRLGRLRREQARQEDEGGTAEQAANLTTGTGLHIVA